MWFDVSNNTNEIPIPIKYQQLFMFSLSIYLSLSLCVCETIKCGNRTSPQFKQNDHKQFAACKIGSAIGAINFTRKRETS